MNSIDTQEDGHSIRIKTGKAAELVNSANLLEISYAPFLYKGFHLADFAHVITLAEAEIIPADAARELLQVLLDIYKIPFEEFVFDPNVGDAYKNRERLVTELSPNAGGWLRTGRARREATNIAYQIAVRDRLLSFSQALANLSSAMVCLAEKHIDTILPDFTYLQHAQPTTLAHYLLSFVTPILRDFDRLRGCFARVNQCSGGIGSVNGSRLPFSRERLASLLGFSSPILHTRDAMWQSDMPVEILSCIMASVLSIDRLAEDLQIWATQEFDLVDIAAGYCRESVIMPQKKNPYSLSFIRGVTGVLSGQLVAMVNVGKTPSGQPDNRIFAYGDVPKTIDLAIKTITLMTGVVSSLSFNVPLMAARAAEGFAQSTDLAECIMQEANLPYLTAHQLVTQLVKEATRNKMHALQITSGMIDQIAMQQLGYPLHIAPDTLHEVLQPENIVATRQSTGGASPASVRRMISEINTAIAEAKNWTEKTGLGIVEAESNLVLTAQAMVAK